MATSREIVKVGGKEIKVGMTNNWRGLIATFVASCDVKQSSRELYVRTLTQYFKWVNESGRVIGNLTIRDILSYKDNLKDKGMSVKTINSYLVVVRKFYQWAEGMKLYPNIAMGVKGLTRKDSKKRYSKQHLNEDMSKELLEHFQNQSLRDFAIVNLILRTGLRTIEVVRANIGDITFMNGKRVLEVWSKGSDAKDSFVALSDKVWIPIQNYLLTRKGALSGDALFVSNSRQNKGQRLTTRTISAMCKEGLQAIGLDGKEFTAHSLRHTTACLLLKNNVSIYDVQNVMRHQSPETTQIYVESIKDELKLEHAAEYVLDDVI